MIYVMIYIICGLYNINRYLNKYENSIIFCIEEAISINCATIFFTSVRLVPSPVSEVVLALQPSSLSLQLLQSNEQPEIQKKKYSLYYHIS